MKSRLTALAGTLLLLNPFAAQYRTALPGYRFEFPRDYFDHPDFQTEWWYYTGNLKSADGHRYGFELTFFRQAVSRDPAQSTTWDLKDIYLAHLALSDLDGQHFYHAERMNRAGPGIASVSASRARIWNGNWEIQWEGADQKLQAIDTQFQLHLKLHPEKPPIIHGENGVSQKSEGAGHASYYFSLTRLAANGQLELNGQALEVSGLAWMDHEFFTHQLGSSQVGWDWLSLQLEDNTELMLFRIRRKDGSLDPFSAGTYVDAQGKSTHLRTADFTLQPLAESWTSPATHATYPIAWEIFIPKLELELRAHTSLAAQELTGKTTIAPSYWEGAITLEGRRGKLPLKGVGYLEMIGYDCPVNLAQ
ncbi:MAG TPA: lipocalin-like domain-containing protein [Candidatus Acidoferrum sp.]|nr:lipocalin-like domain-containing protein [Candidatus Acidoferrum sp.]